MSLYQSEKKLYGDYFVDELQRQVSADKELTQFSIVQVNRISGGVSHYVFELLLSNGTRLYLKKRSDHFAKLPQIRSNPEDIRYEKTILDVFYSLAPDNFPEVKAFNTIENYIVLADAMPGPNDAKLEDLYLAGNVTGKMMQTLGKVLANIHLLSSNFRSAIRDPNDDEHYRLKLQHRLGYRNHPVLNDAIEQLMMLPNKQLILGDVAPKNIAIIDYGNNVKFFDMEEAHLGDPLFDYAYMLGHIIVHNLSNKYVLLEEIEAYQQGYSDVHFNQRLVKIIALGIVLYRLNSIVPYPLNIHADLRIEFESQILSKTLYQDLDKLNLEEIVESLLLRK